MFLNRYYQGENRLKKRLTRWNKIKGGIVVDSRKNMISKLNSLKRNEGYCKLLIVCLARGTDVSDKYE